MTADSPVRVEDLRLAPARRRRERAIRAIFFAAATLAIVVSIAIVISLLGDTITFIQGIEPGTLLADVWQPRSGDYGLATIISGTLVIAVSRNQIVVECFMNSGYWHCFGVAREWRLRPDRSL